MKVKEICAIFETDFSKSYAFDGDNVGLLVGDENSEVQKVLLTCDVDETVVDEAVEIGANLIISHHPVMFRRVGTMIESDPEQRAIRKMIAYNINMYAAHTNLDAANGGINDYMASLVGLKDICVIDVTAQDAKGVHGFGRVGELKEPVKLKSLMQTIAETFGADGLRYAGDEEKMIKKVAVNTGGGADILHECIKLNCDVLITGDIKYNGYRDAVFGDMAVIDIMHFDSEQIVKDFFENYFKVKTNGIEFVKSKANINVVKTYKV